MQTFNPADSNKIAVARIAEVKLHRLSKLDLRGLRLPVLPLSLESVWWIEELDIAFNQLHILSPAIFALNKLKSLNLSNNLLTTLSPEIRSLTALQRLLLSNNQLTTLPAKIGALVNLQALHVDGNQLHNLPAEIGSLSSLQTLHLNRNKLSSLPIEIGRLTQLERLVIEDNYLKELPHSLIWVSRLQELTLHGNEALGLPIEILGPAWLESSGNNPPAKPKIILHYYFAQREGPRRSLNEVKLLVVGECGVGKTSLIRALRGAGYDPQQDKTHGIERHKMELICGRLGKVRLNVWDFGGQDIMHATHQFFLTHRSVYLLVLDSRQNERQCRIDYWLRLIASYGGASPVIIVCNKSDQQVMQLNWTGLQRDNSQIKSYAKEVSCHVSENQDFRQGIEELKTLIAEAIECDVAGVDQSLLTKWLDLKDELERDDRPYLTLDEYYSLANERGIEDRRDQVLLLTLMHQLGSVLHFSEHAIFEKDRENNAAPAQIEELNVLDPGWVTDAIYKLLNDPELIRAGGEMDRGAMRRSLAGLLSHRYPANKEDFIIAMMRRFEICFAFDGDQDRWFLPDLLHKDEVDTGDWTGALSFRYQYRVLPGSVLGRLMVRLHTHIARHCLWRTGAKFKQGTCEALVRSEPEDARLDILIRGGTGPQRRQFLTLIRGTLADIHRSFSGNLSVEELVPVPGNPAVFLDYERLLLLEGKGTASDEVKVDGKLIEFELTDALNGVTDRNARDEERLRLSRKEENPNLTADARSKLLPSQRPPQPFWYSFIAPAVVASAAAILVALARRDWSGWSTMIYAVFVIVFGMVWVYRMRHEWRNEHWPKFVIFGFTALACGGLLASAIGMSGRFQLTPTLNVHLDIDPTISWVTTLVGLVGAVAFGVIEYMREKQKGLK